MTLLGDLPPAPARSGGAGATLLEPLPAAPINAPSSASLPGGQPVELELELTPAPAEDAPAEPALPGGPPVEIEATLDGDQPTAALDQEVTEEDEEETMAAAPWSAAEEASPTLSDPGAVELPPPPAVAPAPAGSPGLAASPGPAASSGPAVSPGPAGSPSTKERLHALGAAINESLTPLIQEPAPSVPAPSGPPPAGPEPAAQSTGPAASVGATGGDGATGADGGIGDVGIQVVIPEQPVEEKRHGDPAPVALDAAGPAKAVSTSTGFAPVTRRPQRSAAGHGSAVREGAGAGGTFKVYLIVGGVGLLVVATATFLVLRFVVN